MRQIDRLHYMDSLRAFAMFLGLVLHAAVPFMQWTIDPVRVHDEPSMFLHYVGELIHVCRMELFFLVAGFFSVMVLQKRGIKNYAKNRFIRIFVPFVLCVLIIQPWAAGQFSIDIKNSEESVFSKYIEFLLSPSYILFENRPVGNWFWHFWFLHLLIYFISIYLIINLLIIKFNINLNFITSWLSALRSKYSVFILVLFTYPVLLFSPPWADVPGIGTSLDVLLYYGLFYFFGAIFFLDLRILDKFQSNLKYHIIPFLIGLIILIPLIDELRLKSPPEILMQNMSLFTKLESQSGLLGNYPIIQNPFNFSALNASFEWHLMCILRAYTTWVGITCFIAFFKKFLSKQSALVRYAADSSYFIYLIHFPIQLCIAYSLRDNLSSAILCFWICLLGSIIICLLFYHFTCRSTMIGVLLSGRKYSLSIRSEFNELKNILTSKPLFIGLLCLVIFSLGAHYYESKKEKKLLYFSLHSELENIKQYVNGKSSEQLNAIQRADGRNSLHMAAHHLFVPRPDEEIFKCVKLLLDTGFSPKELDNYGQTPLHYAVRYANKPAIKLLIEAGADPNAPDIEYGITPLHLAATIGVTDFIKDLLNAGGDSKLTKKNGENSEEIFEKYHSKNFPSK